MAKEEGKSRYRALFEQAQASQTETQETVNPETVKQVKRKAGKQVKRKPVKPEGEPMVNMTVRVPKAWQRHWAIESKRQDVTMSQVMIDALTKQFGLPPEEEEE